MFLERQKQTALLHVRAHASFPPLSHREVGHRPSSMGLFLWGEDKTPTFQIEPTIISQDI